MNDYAERLFRLVDPNIAVRDSIIVLVGLILGRVVGWRVKHLLVEKGLDLYLRLPWTGSDAEPVIGSQWARPKPAGSVLSGATGWFFTLTIWGGALCLLASLHEYSATVQVIRSVMYRCWEVGAVAFTALLIGGWLARAIYDFMRMPWIKGQLDAIFPNRPGVTGSFSETVARGACIVVYAGFLFLMPAVLGGVFGISALSGLVAPTWQLAMRMFTVLVAFAIGYLGLVWVRSETKQVPNEGAPPAVEHAEVEYYLRLGIVTITTALALAFLVGASSGAGAVLFIVFLVFIGFMLWPIRQHLRDLWAGLLLRSQDTSHLKINGLPAKVKLIGPLLTTIVHEENESIRRNSYVLNEVMNGSAERAVTGG